MIATPSMNMNMPSVPVLQSSSSMFQPGSMSAGTPIILAPRLNQLPSAVTASMLTSMNTSGLMSVADGVGNQPASYMYQYDPFVQRMFEYSSSLEPSAAGKLMIITTYC